jgi:hypothetical protein
LFSASAPEGRTPAHYVDQSVCLQIWDVRLPQIFYAKGLQGLKTEGLKNNNYLSANFKHFHYSYFCWYTLFHTG